MASAGKLRLVPFTLAVVGIVLAVLGSASVALKVIALCLGIAALVVRKACGIPRELQKAPRATLALSIITIVLGLMLAAAASQGTSNLSIRVDTGDWRDDTVTVRVQGADDSTSSFDKAFEVKNGESVVVSGAQAGTYQFTVDDSNMIDGTNVYRAEINPPRWNFDKHQDKEIRVSIVLDQEKTKQAQDDAAQKAAKEAEEQKAAEEAAAAQQAEEEAAKKAAEEEAAAQQAAEAQAAQESSSASEPTERTVYITDTGSKYHTAGCSSLSKSEHAISLSSAKAQGYEPCKRCKPGS